LPRLVTDARITGQIALRAGIGLPGQAHTPKTVDFHLQNIYAKAAVPTRAGAALFAG
jgi:DNA-binding NarL/FixJ family response regulator